MHHFKKRRQILPVVAVPNTEVFSPVTFTALFFSRKEYLTLSSILWKTRGYSILFKSNYYLFKNFKKNGRENISTVAYDSWMN